MSRSRRASAPVFFAPSHPQWRLVNLSTVRARQVRVTMIGVAVLLALRHLALALSESVDADAAYQMALRGLGAFCVAFALVAALWRAAKTDCGSEDVLGPRVSGPRDWYGLLRLLLATAAVAILIAVAAGLIFRGLLRRTSLLGWRSRLHRFDAHHSRR